jgi:hypothetical protein
MTRQKLLRVILPVWPLKNKMSLARQIARNYFAYSNRSELLQIASLFNESCTYYSANLGFFIGKADVIAMQTAFHGQYQSLAWTIDYIAEIRPNIIEIEFSFKGTFPDGEEQNRQGREHILIYDGLIQHIAVGL